MLKRYSRLLNILTRLGSERVFRRTLLSQSLRASGKVRKMSRSKIPDDVKTELCEGLTKEQLEAFPPFQVYYFFIFFSLILPVFLRFKLLSLTSK